MSFGNTVPVPSNRSLMTPISRRPYRQFPVRTGNTWTKISIPRPSEQAELIGQLRPQEVVKQVYGIWSARSRKDIVLGSFDLERYFAKVFQHCSPEHAAGILADPAMKSEDAGYIVEKMDPANAAAIIRLMTLPAFNAGEKAVLILSFSTLSFLTRLKKFLPEEASAGAQLQKERIMRNLNILKPVLGGALIHDVPAKPRGSLS